MAICLLVLRAWSIQILHGPSYKKLATHQAFRTVSYRMHVTVHEDGTWSYEEEGVLDIAGRDTLFHHIDRNTLTRVGAPSPNPLARAGSAGSADGSLGIGSLR